MGPSGSGKSTLLRLIIISRRLTGGDHIDGKLVGYERCPAAGSRGVEPGRARAELASAWFPALQPVHI